MKMSAVLSVPVRGLLMWLLLCGGGTPAVCAQPDEERADVDTGGLTIEATAGWDGVVDTTKPVPVSFSISNWSGREIDGRMILSDPVNGHEVSLGEVFVSQESSRTLSSIQAFSDWNECFATLYDGYRVVWRRELPLTTGRGFHSDSVFVLCVEEGGRAAPLPEAESQATKDKRPPAVRIQEDGWPIESLGVKPWQMPRHPGPLSAVQVVVIPEQTSVDLLNAAQWQALADWMCQGGMVVAYGGDSAVAEHLLTLVPLGADPQEGNGAFLTRRVGLGVLATCSLPLFGSDSREAAGMIAPMIRRRSRFHASSHFQAMYPHQYRSGQADSNRAKILGFFAAYMFLSGCVTIALFRQSRRRIAIWTVTVVTGASVMAAILGGMLRVSEGDLRWMSVTQAGAGGAVQIGRLEAQSSGGRNTQVGVSGQHVDLQRVEWNSPRYSYGYYELQDQAGWVPFTWQPSLAENQSDLYRVTTSMAPWGLQRLQATAYVPEIRRLRCELTFKPAVVGDEEAAEETTESEGGNWSEMSVGPAGSFRLKATNPLPMAVREGWLIIGCALQNHQSNVKPLPGTLNIAEVASRDEDRIEVYHRQRLQGIQAEGDIDVTFDADWSEKDYWQLRESWFNVQGGGEFSFPRLSPIETTAAWFVGRLAESPTLAVERGWSEFLVNDEIHLYVQQLRPEEIPELSKLSAPDPR